jgi:hypothetical protein
MSNRKDTLSVTIAGKGERVDALAFAETLRDALEALQLVDEGVSSVDGGSVSWEIVDATLNSPLTVTMSSTPTVAADFSEMVLDVFLDGMEAIDRDGHVPAAFPPPAIGALKRFADHLQNGIGKVTFATKQRRFSPSHRLAEKIHSLTKTGLQAVVDRPDYFEYGEIDGTVENLIAHNQLYFSLYDSLNGVRVRCNITPDLKETVASNWTKRVIVTGRIKYGPHGNPMEIKVESLAPKPGRESLPQFKGVYIDITGGVESSSFIRGLRDDD